MGITLGQVLLPIAEKMADVTGRLITKFEGWSPKIQVVFNRIKELLAPAKELAEQWLPTIASKIKELVGGAVIPALVTAFNKVKDVINDNVIPAFEAVINFVKTKIPEAFDASVQHVKRYKDEYIALGAAIGAAVLAIALFKTAITIGAGLKAAAAAFAAIFAAVTAPMTIAIVLIGAAVGGIVLLALKSEDARNALGAMADFVKQKIESVIAVIERAVSLVQQLIDISKKVAAPVVAAKEAGLFQAIGQTPFFKAAGGLLDFAGGVVSGIRERAEGGIVTRPEISLIGEAGPEAIIPLDRLNPNPSGMNVTVNMPAGADGNDVVQALEDYVRRNGSIPVAVNNLVRK